MKNRLFLLLAITAGAALLPAAGHAKPARCYTTDDGEYDCSFVATDDSGSFEISAPDKPKFSLVISEPGIGYLFGDYHDGSGNVALPSRYLRSESDPACWTNEDTEAQVCTW
jgi:hypothetical protein